MATRDDLQTWIVDALNATPRKSGRIVDICKHVWGQHEADLKASVDLFYTWQYDIRWAANRLRRNKQMKSIQMSPKGLWELP
jgi:hypothetical protein